MVLGIQQQSNTEALFRRANELGVKYVLGEDIVENNLPNIEHVLLNFLNRSDTCYLSVDMDVFDASDSPGVSAPAVPGVDKRMLFRILKSVLASNKLIAFDIAETNPVYDSEAKTARLAAWLVYQLVSQLTA
jgi:formiminoglutamase